MKFLIIYLAFALFLVNGCGSNLDDANRISITLPDGRWVIDDQMLETVRTGDYDNDWLFVAGIPSIMPGFSDPSIMISSTEATGSVKVGEFVDMMIDSEAFGETFNLAGRYTSSIAGYPAEVLTFDVVPSNPQPGLNYASESNLIAAYFLKNSRWYSVQCSAIYANSVADLDPCWNAAKTLEFYKETD